MLCRMMTEHSRQFWWTSVVLAPALALSAAGLAQQSAPPADAIVIDFVATTNDGKPVTDLKAEDLTLRVDGRQRTLRSFELVQHGGSSAPGKPGGDPPPMPFGVNNAPDRSRAILFAIEDLSIKANSGRALKDTITQFLNNLPSSARVGLVTLPQPTLRVDLAPGTARVKEALQQLSGRAPASATAADNACRTRDTLEALRNIMNSLAGSDSPTTIMVFSGGLVGTARQASQTGSGGCDLTTEHFSSLGRASGVARAQVYVIHAEETVTGQSDGLESLAGVTGGSVLRLAVSGESAVDRAARETSSYYVASFEPEAKERDGQDHRMELRLARQDVSLRARSLLTIPKGAATGKSGATNPRDMVKQTAAYRDLPLRVVAYPSRGTGDSVNIFIMAEPLDPATKLTGASAAVVDKAGKATTVSIEEKQLAARPIMTTLASAPGSYRVRFAATDANGRSGAVDYTVNAELVQAGPLKMSGLVVAALRDKAMAPTMQFKDEPTAIGYVEIYGQLTGQVAARMEVAETLDGPALKTIQPGGQKTSEADKFLLIGEIPIADLKPGDYVVRAFVSIQGQPEGKVLRTLRKTQ